MQYFYIKAESTLPTLRVELIYDGRYDFLKNTYFYEAIQNADVTFSMWDEHEVLKISNAPCNIVLTDKDSCDERYIIEYVWKTRDTKKPGLYKGQFKISFKDDIYKENETYNSGDLIMPIYEDLSIQIQP